MLGGIGVRSDGIFPLLNVNIPRYKNLDLHPFAHSNDLIPLLNVDIPRYENLDLHPFAHSNDLSSTRTIGQAGIGNVV